MKTKTILLITTLFPLHLCAQHKGPYIGDLNGDNRVTIADLCILTHTLVSDTDAPAPRTADVDQNGTINLSDAEALAGFILHGTLTSLPPIKLQASVYAQQLNSENTAGPDYQITSIQNAVGPVDAAPIFTALTLDISAIPDVQSVSIFARGKEKIAGPMSCNILEDQYTPTFSDGTAPSVYVSNMASDVVQVINDNNATTLHAYLRPVTLSQGVTVTVRTTDGTLHSQDYSTVDASEPLVFTETKAPGCWMATVPGNVYFSMLSTPGAHDAATSKITGFSASAAKCQDDDLATLLANGVRMFDIRPGYMGTTTLTDSNLYIYHGQVSTNVLYTDAISIFADFLKGHPSESISIVQVKENNKPTLGGSEYSDRSSEMWAVINACQNQYADYFLNVDHSYYTLDDLRGKIMFFNRNGTATARGFMITNWPDNGMITDYSAKIANTCYANIEDNYNDKGDTKKNDIKTMLDYASSNTNKARYHFTYTSVAYAWGSSITKSAEDMNPYTAGHLTSALNGPAGYVLSDFMGSSSYSGKNLLNAIVAQNYKYAFIGRTRQSE